MKKRRGNRKLGRKLWLAMSGVMAVLLCFCIAFSNVLPAMMLEEGAVTADAEAVVESAEAQVEDEAAPVENAEAPIEDEAAPVEDAEASIEDETAPVEDAEAPIEDEAAPVEDAEAPIEDEAAPVEDAEAPTESEAVLMENAEAQIEDEEGEPVKHPEPQMLLADEAQSDVELLDAADANSYAKKLKFEDTGKGMSVYVCFNDDSGLTEAMTLIVKTYDELNDAEKESISEQISEETGANLGGYCYIDIDISDGENSDIQPLTPVRVIIKSELNHSKDCDWKLLHFAATGCVELDVSSASIVENENMDTVQSFSFVTDRFSGFALCTVDVVELDTYLSTQEYGSVKVSVTKGDYTIQPDENGDYTNLFGNYYTRIDLKCSVVPAKGTYTYQLPGGLVIPEDCAVERPLKIEESTITSGTHKTIGTYSISSTGLLTLRYANVPGNNYWGYITFDMSSGGTWAPAVSKSSSFNLTENAYVFTIDADIPAFDGGTKEQFWLTDTTSIEQMSLLNPEVNYFGVTANSAYLTVTLSYGGNTYTLKEVSSAGDEDTMAYYLNAQNGSLTLLNRCTCGCADDNAAKNDTMEIGGKIWCTNWELRKDSKLRVVYIDKYGSQYFKNYAGKKETNTACLNYRCGGEGGNVNSYVSFELPSIGLNKTADFEYKGSGKMEQYVGTYTLTVDTKNDPYLNSGLKITDYSNTLTYDLTTINVTAEGSTEPLVKDVDYTLTTGTYPTTGNKDAKDGANYFEITVTNPEQTVYTVTYTCTADAAASEIVNWVEAGSEKLNATSHKTQIRDNNNGYDAVYILPDCGGNGNLFAFSGLVMSVLAVVCIVIAKRKKERHNS